MGLGPGQATPEEFERVVDLLEAAGTDSLWLSEHVFSAQLDPFVGVTHALARTRSLKVGTGVAVLPGRNPVLVVKQLVSLAALSPGRVLPVFGVAPARAHDRTAFPVPGPRGAVFDESLQLVRALLSGAQEFRGEFYQVQHAEMLPLPSKPLDIWIGGSAPAALRRAGRLADGWLASFITPQEAADGRREIERAADDAGRDIEDDHFGLSLAIGHAEDPALLEAARRRRPDTDPELLVARSFPHARELLQQHVHAGLSKFVVRPAGAPLDQRFLDRMSEHLLDLQN